MRYNLYNDLGKDSRVWINTGLFLELGTLCSHKGPAWLCFWKPAPWESKILPAHLPAHAPLFPARPVGKKGGFRAPPNNSLSLSSSQNAAFYKPPSSTKLQVLERSGAASCNTIREIGSWALDTALHPAEPQRVPGEPFAGFNFSGAASAGGH